MESITLILGISQPYLYRIFVKKCGRSPKQYLEKCKLKEAKRLLCETDMSITEVANSIGFPDVLAFSKFFKHSTHISPSNFSAFNFLK